MTRRLNDVLKDLNNFTEDFMNAAIRKQATAIEAFIELDLNNFAEILSEQGVDRESAPTLQARFGGNFTPKWANLRPLTRYLKNKYGITQSENQKRFFYHHGNLKTFLGNPLNTDHLIGNVRVEVSSNVVRTGKNPGQYRVQGIRNSVSTTGARAGKRQTGIVPKAEFDSIRMLRVRIRLDGTVSLDNDEAIDNSFPESERKKLKNLGGGRRPYRPLVGPYLRWYIRKRLPELVERKFKDVLVA